MENCEKLVCVFSQMKLMKIQLTVSPVPPARVRGLPGEYASARPLYTSGGLKILGPTMPFCKCWMN